MELVEKYLENKEQSKISKSNLYLGINKLLNKIYFEYDFTKSNELTDYESFYPVYAGDVSFGILFGLDFSLVHKANSRMPKPKKKIVNDSEQIKVMFPKLYEFMKNNFLKRIINLDEYLEWINFNTSTNKLFSTIVDEFKIRDKWATRLYLWYFTNKLTNSIDFNNLYLLLANCPTHIFVDNPKTTLDSIYLFDDYEITFFTTNMYQCLQFENSLYKIQFGPYTRYLNGYTPLYTIDIFDKKTNVQINYVEKFGHHLRMLIDSIYEQIICFIRENSKQAGWICLNV